MDNQLDNTKVLEYFQKEYRAAKDQIERNEVRLDKLKFDLKELRGQKSEQLKVFSPRNLENLNKEEIDSRTREIDDLELSNKTLQEKCDMYYYVLENLNTGAHDISDTLYFLNLLEEDRKSLVRQLHNNSLQNIANMIHRNELVSMYLTQDIERAKLEINFTISKLKESIDLIRRDIETIRPMIFDDFGLKDALERMVSLFNKNKKYEMDVFIDVPSENTLVACNIYRIIQECFNNIEKHAQAKRVYFKCVQNDQGLLIIDIEDDGNGFVCDENAFYKDQKYGICMIRERVNLLRGRFSILSEIDNGAKIHVEIPMYLDKSIYGSKYNG